MSINNHAHDGAGQESYRKQLLIILAVAVSVRIFWLVTETAVIESEGAEYARIAENLRAGTGYLGNMPGPELVFPPLYPILIAFVSFFTRNFEAAGRITSLATGVLLILPIFFVALKLYGRRVALISAALTALHPLLIALSASVYSEGSFLTLVMGGVYWGLRAIHQEAKWAALFAGGCFGLAYLVRPEAIVLAPLVCLAILAVALMEHKSFVKGLLSCGMLLVSFGVLAAPYVAFLSSHTGHLRVEGKKNINLTISQRMNQGKSYLQAAYGISDDLREDGPLLDPDGFVDKAPAMSAKDALGYFLAAASRNKAVLYSEIFPSYVFGPILIAMVILGLFARPWNGRRTVSELYLLLVFSFFFLLMLSIHVFFFRYAIPILPFLILWCAKGIDGFGKWAGGTARLVKWQTFLQPRSFQRTASWGVCAALLALAFIGMRGIGEFEQAKPKYQPVKEAGLWIRNYGGSKRIMSTNDTITFYASGTEFEFPYCDSSLALAYIHQKKVDFIALNALHGLRSRPYMEEWIKNGIPDPHAQLVFQSGQRPEEKVLIYRWVE